VVTSGRLGRRRLLRPLTARDRGAVDDALEAVGLTDQADRGVSELSGGQQQRVLIARALAGEADLYVLDEPTAGVDLLQQDALADTLRVMAGRGATVVLVAHELGPMAPLVDRVVVMRDGRVGYDGPPNPAVIPTHSHAGDHHDGVVPHDHAPHVAGPLEQSGPVTRAEEGPR
jgi:zinc transport system ATP-binding protein